MRPTRLLAALSLLGCGTKAPDGPRLYSDLGSLHIPISASPAAQPYFDQGMKLVYGFNHAEAIRAFEHGATIDPNCAICWWGVALALGPNINAPMDSASGVAARAAIDRATRLASHASPRERRFIDALATRYAPIPPTTRAGLDSAYAAAMARVVEQLPNDHEALTLYAESLMDLRPWAYWDGPGRPAPGTDRILASLEQVMTADSTHPGACHYYIHAVEAVEPARAVACAERLARLMPGAGHVVHMPTHIYVRVGRYREAIALNEHAAHADSSFAASERMSPAYAVLYATHNFHFLAFAAMLSGDTAKAVNSARETVARMPADAALAMPEFQAMVAFEHQIQAKFGRWNEVLALPLPSAELPIGRAVAEYARGTAQLALGRADSARALLDSVSRRVARVQASTANPIAKGVAEITRRVFAARMARHAGRTAEAVAHLEAAAAIEDGLGYMEPPYWIEPVRQTLGLALLDAGRKQAAERAFRDDLDRFPKNVWSTEGLARATGTKPSAQ